MRQQHTLLSPISALKHNLLIHFYDCVRTFHHQTGSDAVIRFSLIYHQLLSPVLQTIHPRMFNKISLHLAGAGILVSSHFIARLPHLLPDHSILVPISIIRALIIPVRHDPHIIILVHVHIAQIRPVFIVINVECAGLTACSFFSLHLHSPLYFLPQHFYFFQLEYLQILQQHIFRIPVLYTRVKRMKLSRDFRCRKLLLILTAPVRSSRLSSQRTLPPGTSST